MKHLTIIFSGNYISPSLQAEFGKVLPVMLPIGNRMLLEYQIEATLPGDIMVTVPDDIHEKQIAELIKKRKNLIVRKTKKDESLCASMLQTISDSRIEKYQKITIVLGDSLVNGSEWKENTYSFHKPMTNYAWSTKSNKNGCVFSGYIMCSNRADLILAINKCKERDEPIFSSLFFEDFYSNNTGLWYDFGHYHNYHVSKRDFVSYRHFNSINVTDFSIIKSSNDKKKMAGEAEWYYSCPTEISYHCPKIYGSSEGKYEIEYLYANTLSELSIYSNLPKDHWDRIVNSALAVLEKFKPLTYDKRTRHDFRDFVITKTSKRMESTNEYPFDPDELILFDGNLEISLSEIKDYCINNWPLNLKGHKSFVHGDFCFSNLLYDARSMQIKMIDPRGIDENGEINSIGYLEYDVAKFAHSHVYLYDKVISGGFETKFSNRALTSNYMPLSGEKRKEFWQKAFTLFGISERQLKYLVMNLFLSMVPLHKDNYEHQLSFAYIAIHIFVELREESDCPQFLLSNPPS